MASARVEYPGPPPKFLALFLLIVDIQMLLYWSAAAFRELRPSTLPQDHLYNDYYNPIMVAWNWSFFPLDMILSVTGLVSVYWMRIRHPRWPILATFSLALTFCAGLMAIAFWAIRREFDALWWGSNAAYVVGALWFLARIK